MIVEVLGEVVMPRLLSIVINSGTDNTLTVEKSYVCIADIDGRERLCYLAVCPFNGGKVWAYIDYFRYEVIKMQKNSFTDSI
jgi:hypothetical protein